MKTQTLQEAMRDIAEICLHTDKMTSIYWRPIMRMYISKWLQLPLADRMANKEMLA